MWKRIAAFAVHGLTASGAVLGLLALERAAAGDLRLCFLFLGAALIVDAVDGPLARVIRVAEVLPRFSGVRLDLIVDYLTYCLVPAYIVLKSQMVPAPLAPWAAGAILVSSLYHFCDRESKTADGYFVGFPAIWNIVVFHFFALQPPAWIAATAVALLVALTFVPILWVHPLRATRFRPVTLAVLACWSIAALSVLLQEPPAGEIVRLTLAMAAAYATGLCLLRTFVLRCGEG
ncbi:MAG: phosphatidylcholine synthase [Pseudomonadota bacterium]|nr:phosphatidylcholine synthase [Pseudomonadota bacterium]